jgi:hypothetical protein
MKAKALARRQNNRPRASPRLRRRSPGACEGRAGAPSTKQPVTRPGPLLQPVLRVGAADDPLEHEAERTAERVVSMSAPGLTTPATAPAERAAAAGARRSAEDQPSLDALETHPPLPPDHQDPKVASEEDVEATELGAEDLKEVESERPSDPGVEEPPPGEPVDPSPFPPVQADRSGGPAAVGREGGAAPAEVASRVAQPGAGRPLPEALRSFMEPRFGVDFSAVRLHDQASDRDAARRIGARAFTHREHVWIGPGESVEDRRLMAHELTHVVQQGGDRDRSPGRERALTRSPAETPIRRAGYLAEKAEGYARNVPGYTLISVLLGESPITGDRVARNAVNLIGGFLGLLPGGNLLFERLRETRALENAFDWVSSRLSSLNITWSRISRLIDEVIDLFPTLSPVQGIKRIFAPVVDDLLTFVGEIKDKILEFIVKGALKLAGPYADRVWAVIEGARETLSTILEDPLGFAKNLFKAVLKGFQQFASNAFEHLRKGLLGWLFGALQGMEIQLPERLDFKGLISIGLQVLGLTYDRFRGMLVKRLGKNGERKVAFLEKSVEVVGILVKEGFVGVWQKMLSLIDGFKQTVVGGIRDFVTTTLIKGGLSWLAGLSNPVGAVVKVVLSIYSMIVTFLERLDQILEVAKSIFASIGAIASGKIQQAADFVERTIGATVPVVISFLAALVPITGITRSIRKVIEKLRRPVEQALKKLLDFVVKKAKKLLSKVIGKLNAKRRLPSANFTIGKQPHQYFVKKKGKKVDVFVKTEEQTTDAAERGMQQECTKLGEGSVSKTEATAVTAAFDKQEDKAEQAAGHLKPGDTKVNQEGPNKKMQRVLSDGAKVISEKGKLLADNPDVDTGHPKLLIRAVEPRFDNEGMAGTYSAVKKESGKEAPGTGLTYSAYYEADHVPEKSLLQGINAKAGSLAGGEAGDTGQEGPGEKAAEVIRATEGATAAEDAQPVTGTAEPAGFGQLASLADEPGGEGGKLKAILIYRPVHREKPNNFAKATLAKVDEILAGKTSPAAKEGAIKAVMAQQIHDEVAAVKKLYIELDKGSAGDVRKRVFTGLDGMVTDANDLYDIAATTAAHAEEDLGEGDESGARNELTFGGPQGFAEREGVAGPYGRLGTTGSFFERDHIVDQSFPKALQGLKLGDEPLWQKSALDKETPTTSNDPEMARSEMDDRRSQLKALDLFHPTSPMAGYTENNGWALFVYRPVHRRVTARTSSGGAKGELIGGLQTSAFASARSYVQGRKGSSKAKALEGIRNGLKKPFAVQTDEHIAEVRKEYAEETAKVEAANPGRQAQARAAMKTITDRVEKSLGRMRTESLNLFQ